MTKATTTKKAWAAALAIGVLAAGTHAFAGGGGHGGRCGKRFEKADADGDGAISKEEFESGMMARFLKRSKKREERKAKRAARMAEKGLTEADMAARKAEHKEKRAARRAAWAAENPEAAARWAARPKLDADGDGAVSAAELTAAAAHHFNQLDKDGDGALSAEEFKAAKRSRKRGRGGRRHRGGGRGFLGGGAPRGDG